MKSTFCILYISIYNILQLYNIQNMLSNICILYIRITLKKTTGIYHNTYSNNISYI